MVGFFPLSSSSVLKVQTEDKRTNQFLYSWEVKLHISDVVKLSRLVLLYTLSKIDTIFFWHGFSRYIVPVDMY